jgi:hypothetical protein
VLLETWSRCIIAHDGEFIRGALGE